MDLRSIQYFVRIADLGSLTRAAGHLHVAQPALSRHIRRLEEELDVELFSRSPRGVRLTSAGQLLYEHAQRILRDVERTRDEIRALGGSPSGKVVLGVPPTVCPLLVPRLVGRMRRESPKVDLKIMEGFSVQLQEWLLNDTIDCAVMTDMAPNRQLSGTKLVDEDIVLATARGLRKRAPTVTGVELSRTPLIMTDPLRQIIEPILERSGVRLTVAIELNAIETIRLMVQQRLGATLMPYSVMHADCLSGAVEARVVIEPRLRRTLVFASHATRRQTFALEELERAVRTEMIELESEGYFTCLPQLSAPRQARAGA